MNIKENQILDIRIKYINIIYNTYYSMIWIKYKLRQEKILIEEIASSSFITSEVLYEIKKYYNDTVPYHNFLHVLQVTKQVLRLNPKEINIVEIKSLFYAALFHDAWHTGQANLLDEFNSLDIALKSLHEFEHKYNIWFYDQRIIREAIVWTVFSKRWLMDKQFALILWDLDIWVLGLDFLEFCYYGFPFWYEMWLDEEEYITKTEIWYFKYLLSFDKEILLSKEVKEISPNVFKNIKKFLNTDTELKIEMMKVIKNEDITYDEFYQKFNK